MWDFWEDVALPFIIVVFGVMFVIFTIYGSISGIQALLESKECKIWGGKYAISTGCLMKIDNKLITLNDYRRINVASITKPIETNANVNVNIKQTKGGNNE